MSVDANVAYTLAQNTGLNAELCKLALERSKNNAETAMQLLKRWGKVNIINKSNRSSGIVCTYFCTTNNAGSIVKITCTDELLSKSKEYYEFVGETTSELAMWGESYVQDVLKEELQTKYKCEIDVKFERFEKSNPLSLITTYTHRDQIASIVEMEVDTQEAFDNRLFKIFAYECVLHIAAFDPIAVDKQSIPQDLKHEVQCKIEKQLAQDGKDMKHWAVATEGKMTKWAEQRSLLNQIFIKRDTDTVETVRKEVSANIGSDIRIKRFARFSIEA